MRPKPLTLNLAGALRTLTPRTSIGLVSAAWVLRWVSFDPSNSVPKLSKNRTALGYIIQWFEKEDVDG